jgi:hypothetical protein
LIPQTKPNRDLGCASGLEDTSDSLREQRADESLYDYLVYVIGRWTVMKGKQSGLVDCVKKYEARKQ